VEAAGQPEMSLKIRPSFPEKFEDGFSLRRHKGLLYH
jgi:hypothetical protein